MPSFGRPSAAAGIEISTEGDAFFVVFQDATAALAAAVEAQRSLAAEQWPLEAGRCACGWAFTRARESSAATTTSASTSIGRPALRAAAHGGQVLSPQRPRPGPGSLPPERDSATWASIGSRISSGPSASCKWLGPGWPTTSRRRGRSKRRRTSPLRSRPSSAGNARSRRSAGSCDDSRLVTLTGPGGTGKSRLEPARRRGLAGEYPGGAFFVELAPTHRPGPDPDDDRAGDRSPRGPRRPVIELLEGAPARPAPAARPRQLRAALEGATIVGRLLEAAPAAHGAGHESRGSPPARRAGIPGPAAGHARPAICRRSLSAGRV